MTPELPNIQTKEGQQQLKEMGIKTIPLADDVTRPYWEAANRHELSIQRCKACSEFRHPPAEKCHDCGSSDVEWVKLSGQGTVYAFVIDHRLLLPGFDEPYVVAQITPDEAGDNNMVRITANVLDCDLHDVYVGMPVEVFFVQHTPEMTLPQFRPAAGAKLKSRGETP